MNKDTNKEDFTDKYSKIRPELWKTVITELKAGPAQLFLFYFIRANRKNYNKNGLKYYRNQCIRGYDEIEATLGFSNKTIVAYNKQLEKLGLIKKIGSKFSALTVEIDLNKFEVGDSGWVFNTKEEMKAKKLEKKQGKKQSTSEKNTPDTECKNYTHTDVENTPDNGSIGCKNYTVNDETLNTNNKTLNDDCAGAQNLHSGKEFMVEKSERVKQREFIHSLYRKLHDKKKSAFDYLSEKERRGFNFVETNTYSKFSLPNDFNFLNATSRLLAYAKESTTDENLTKQISSLDTILQRSEIGADNRLSQFYYLMPRLEKIRKTFVKNYYKMNSIKEFKYNTFSHFIVYNLLYLDDLNVVFESLIDKLDARIDIAFEIDEFLSDFYDEIEKYKTTARPSGAGVAA